MMMEPLPAGTSAIVDEVLDEAAQTIFSAADVPLARRDELLAALQGPAARAVLEARIEQIVKRGHTAESDALLALDHLPKEAIRFAQMAAENITGIVGARDLVVARRRLAKAAALCLAAIDRLDMIKES